MRGETKVERQSLSSINTSHTMGTRSASLLGWAVPVNEKKSQSAGFLPHSPPKRGSRLQPQQEPGSPQRKTVQKTCLWVTEGLAKHKLIRGLREAKRSCGNDNKEPSLGTRSPATQNTSRHLRPRPLEGLSEGFKWGRRRLPPC